MSIAHEVRVMLQRLEVLAAEHRNKELPKWTRKERAAAASQLHQQLNSSNRSGGKLERLISVSRDSIGKARKALKKSEPA